MGSNDAFEQIINQHKGILYKVVNAYCKDEEDRKDLVQEIMIQLWKSFDKYKQEYKITTWIYRIALNTAISFYRKNAVKNTNTILMDDKIIHLEESKTTDLEQNLVLLEQFINELKEFDKALMLLYLEDRNQQEMADILGISTSNVSTKIARIKEKLKQRFSNHNNR